MPSFNGGEGEKFLGEVDGDELANRAAASERDFMRLCETGTSLELMKSSIERKEPTEDQFQTFMREVDDDDLANNTEASELDFMRLSGTRGDPMRSSIEERREPAEDQFQAEFGGDDGLASCAEANEGDSNAHNLNASSSIEARMAIAVRDIAADIIKNIKSSKKNSVKAKDTDKEKKKTLKKLSYHEKMLRNVRLVEEHLIEQTSGISPIVYSCRTCGKEFPPTVNKVNATRHAISHGVSKKRQRGQNRIYECAFCGITVKTKKEHVKHYQDIHHE